MRILPLSKRDYMAGLQCAKKLYLQRHRPELGAEPCEADRARMDDGIEIGRLARSVFPDGILVEGAEEEATTATKLLMHQAAVIFEAQFEAEGCIVRVDLLLRDGKSWRVVEVKSSKEPKEGDKPKAAHIEDLAFQVYVLRSAGIKISSASLMLLKRGAKAGPPGDPAALLVQIDVTEEVEKLLIDARFRAERMIEVLSGSSPPAVETNVHCLGCAFYGYCHVNQPQDDLVFLPRIRETQVTELRRTGVRTIGEVPDSFRLTPLQARVRDVVRQGKPYVDEHLAERLAAIQFPICFIDFEATKWVIPEIAGTESHQAIPFQWSCHTLARPGAQLGHSAFLSRTDEDPRPAFASSLWEQVRAARSLMVYSPYEMGILKGLAAEGTPYGAELQEVLGARGVDLLRIVQECVYLRAFQGHFSIKTVLPAMVPDMSYADLAIRDGEAASIAYKKMISPYSSAEDRDVIAANLLAYCERDTLAMVALYWALRAIAAPARPVPDDTRHEQLVLNL